MSADADRRLNNALRTARGTKAVSNNIEERRSFSEDAETIPAAPHDSLGNIRHANSYSDLTKQHALAVIGNCGGSLTIASQRLGISIPTLSRWRSEHGKNLAQGNVSEA